MKSKQRGFFINPYQFSYSLSATDALAGMDQSSFAVVSPYFTFFASKVNDGNPLDPSDILNTYCSRTYSSGGSYNNGHGIEITFSTARRIGRISISCYRASDGAVCDFLVQYFSGSWLDAGTAVANGSPAAFDFQNIDCNAAKSITATKWRIIVQNWVESNPTNFYIGGLQAYEWP